MYVCVCNAVTEVEVRACLEAGATSVEAVTRACGAGGDCGACHGAIEELMAGRSCAGPEARRTPLPVVRERAA